VDSPLAIAGETKAPARAAPEMGEHADAILAELGYGPGDIRALRATGALG
jgi:formyl-CoA transferase